MSESGGSTRQTQDWITAYLDYTESSFAPHIFRLWAGITALAGALERRVWTRTRKILYPNLYTLLVGPPTSGKTEAVQEVKKLWIRTPGLRVAPDSMSYASIVDDLHNALRTISVEGKGVVSFHSMQVAVREFGVLFPAWDEHMMNKLTDWWDCPDEPYRETRRHGPQKEVVIAKPQINMLAATTPATLSKNVPEVAWNMGFCSRLMLIYQPTDKIIDPFNSVHYSPGLEAALIADLTHFAALYGEVPLDHDTVAAARAWHMAGGPPRPTYNKLEHYCGRRTVMVLKVALVSAVSRGGTSVAVADFERAKAWMIEAEKKMPDVFRAMVFNSDHDILHDLKDWMWDVYAKQGKRPVHGTLVWNFLASRTPSEKITRILETAVNGGYVEEENGFWKPTPKKVEPE